MAAKDATITQLLENQTSNPTAQDTGAVKDLERQISQLKAEAHKKDAQVSQSATQNQ